MHLIPAMGPARTASLRLSMGALIFLAPEGELWTDPDITRATPPDSPTRRTGQYARICAMADAVYLAFRFGDLT
jgi:threonine/homoserine efflux transporter RhtA